MRFTNRGRGPTDYRVNFDYPDLRRAKAVILWRDDWQQATRATVDILDELDLIHAGTTVVDYGCGIGRITQAIRGRHDVRVLAVDRSASMREHARQYLSAEELQLGRIRLLSDTDLMADSAVAGTVNLILMIEVLQHIPEPILDELLPRLKAMLESHGRLFVLGNDRLDVDRQGRSGSPIEPVLSRYLRIERRDRWTDGFAHTRYSFVGVVPPGGIEPPLQP